MNEPTLFSYGEPERPAADHVRETVAHIAPHDPDDSAPRKHPDSRGGDQ